MKIAISGKGGVGKTSLTAWLGDYLARRGEKVWLVDADTALSLGQASGLDRAALPEPLTGRAALIEERIRPAGKGGMMDLDPHVSDLPEVLSAPLPLAGSVQAAQGEKRLLVMGPLTNAGGGCACEGNALLKALLAHLVLDRREWVLVDMEAGVEHLGRGTVAHVDALLVVAEPSMRSLETAAEVARMASDLGLRRQVLVINKTTPQQAAQLPPLAHLPEQRIAVPDLEALRQRQMYSGLCWALARRQKRNWTDFAKPCCKKSGNVNLLHSSGHGLASSFLRINRASVLPGLF